MPEGRVVGSKLDGSAAPFRTMPLRLRLVLAFLGLAVVPLLAVTLYSYFSSARALREAAHEEARASTEDLDRRMDEVSAHLAERLERMRARIPKEDTSAFAQARRDALAAAEQEETRRVLAGVLALTERRRGEVPFAIDDTGQIYAAEEADKPVLEALSVRLADETGRGAGLKDEWIVVPRKDARSGITLGIARPVGESLRAMWHATALNLALGLTLVVLALLGTLPLSRGMTRDLALLAEGAESLARGDLDTRVPVRSKDELGRLAATFNRMAEELRLQQDRRVERERLKKELEMCRRIQEELLPRTPGRFSFAEAEGVSIPAREVGGDFFNYFPLSPAEAAVLVGDVSGKGVAAALLMANLQATLRARLPLESDLVTLAERLDHEIDAGTPSTVYLTLFVAVVDGASGIVRYVNAGHNPPVLLRSHGAAESLPPTGRPLGLFPGGGYVEGRAHLGPGDALFLYTDGLVEAEDERGEPFGIEKLEALLMKERASSPTGLLARVEESLHRHRGAQDPSDDATMVVLRLCPPAFAGAGS
jgi:serine phosphatase RsbU (regulator of sigma subunit)